MNSGSGTKVLVRKRDGRMVAGVCAGIADYLGTDVTLVRVIVAAIALLTGGAGLLAYLVAWIIIPEEDQKTPVDERMAAQPHDSSVR
ncbi:MAG TPA: PspC domain-containing protein [Streptosporangiaceae bacterium]|nr:PspC domain-containing protein [Streptosporangiaceae bacterium]